MDAEKIPTVYSKNSYQLNICKFVIKEVSQHSYSFIWDRKCNTLQSLSSGVNMYMSINLKQKKERMRTRDYQIYKMAPCSQADLAKQI